MPTETDKAWEIFTYYRDMKYLYPSKKKNSGGRSFSEMADRGIVGSMKSAEKLSQAWGWRDRVRAYDEYIDQNMKQPQTMRQAKEIVGEQLKTAQILRGVGMKMLRNIDQAIDKNLLSPKEYMTIMDKLFRISFAIEKDHYKFGENDSTEITLIQQGQENRAVIVLPGNDRELGAGL